MHIQLAQSKRIPYFFGILISFFLFTSCSAPKNLPMFRGDLAHLGVYNAPAARILPDVKWKFKADDYITSSPAIFRDLLYFGSEDGNLYALNRESGTEKWRFATQGPVHSSPAIADGVVYFQSNDGFVYALDALSGDQKWKVDTGPIRGTDYDYISSSPAVADGVIYIGGANGNLYALESVTGKQVWVVPALGPTPVRSSPAVADGVVYFTADKYLVALDAISGKQKWVFTTTITRSSPTVHDGLVFFGNNASSIYAVDAATGEQRWQQRIDYYWVASTAAVSDDVVYISGDDSYLNALDEATGEVKWRFKTRGETIWSSPAVVNDVIYIGDWNFTNAENEAGETLWGYLYGVDAKTGEKLWEFKTDGNIVSSPLVDENGIIYFGSLDGYLYALDGSK